MTRENKECVGWLALCLDLADLEAVSAPDFEDLATSDLDRLREPLHGFFARRGETHIVGTDRQPPAPPQGPTTTLSGTTISRSLGH